VSDCLFCKIVAGETAAQIVKRSDRFVAFRDIDPRAPMHVLVVPTHHVGSLNDVKDPTLLGGLMLFAREIAQEAGIAPRGYRIVLNTNPDGGQTVFHLHVHVLGGRVMNWPPG
jgi:histidine triad (HIT) family protein